MKITSLLILGTLISLSAFSATEVADSASEDGKKTPADKVLEKIKSDPTKNPETSDTFSSGNLSQFAKDPVFSTESADQKERDKVIEKNQNGFDNSTAGHVQALYACTKIGDAKGAKECRANAMKPKKKKQ